jgi:hypothetical protein
MSTAAATTRTSPAASQRWSPEVREVAFLGGYLAVALIAGAIWLEYLTRGDSQFSRDLATPLWTIAVGVATNASCAILGCYLVLRRMSLLGDAISHAVLPGNRAGLLLLAFGGGLADFSRRGSGGNAHGGAHAGHFEPGPGFGRRQHGRRIHVAVRAGCGPDQRAGYEKTLISTPIACSTATSTSSALI